MPVLATFSISECAIHAYEAPEAGGYLNIEFTAEAANIAPPQADAPGSVRAAGLQSEGIWSRVAAPLGADKEAYAYRNKSETVQVSGVAKWNISTQSALFEGELRIAAREFPQGFVQGLNEGGATLPIVITWGDDAMIWEPEIIWVRMHDGRWEGRMVEE
jgi:hypothetical protein